MLVWVWGYSWMQASQNNESVIRFTPTDVCIIHQNKNDETSIKPLVRGCDLRKCDWEIKLLTAGWFLWPNKTKTESTGVLIWWLLISSINAHDESNQEVDTSDRNAITKVASWLHDAASVKLLCLRYYQSCPWTINQEMSWVSFREEIPEQCFCIQWSPLDTLCSRELEEVCNSMQCKTFKPTRKCHMEPAWIDDKK